MSISQGFHSVQSDARLMHRQGVVALEEQRMEDAVLAFRQAVELDPNFVCAWNDLGVVMEALGNPMEALRCYRQALSVQPEQSEAKSNLGMLMLQLDLVHALHRQAFTSSAA